MAVACDVVDLEDVLAARSGPDRADVVVVIDVIRAFTTAVAAIDGGAAEVHCVAELDAARELAARLPGSLLMGEERGRRPRGFDAGNSPFDLDDLDLHDRVVVQRTSNGTRGLARFAAAPLLLAAAAVNVGATGRWVRARGVDAVSLVCTGTTPEDRACAEHLAAVVTGGGPDPTELRAAVLATARDHIAWWSTSRSIDELAAFHADVDVCARVDRSSTVLVGRPLDGAVVLRPAP